MAPLNHKPYSWLKLNKITGDYTINFRVQLVGQQSLPAAPQPPVGNPLTRTFTVTYVLTGGGAGGQVVDATPYVLNTSNGFDPASYDNIVIEIRSGGGGNPLLGKSTVNTTEADASGGGGDDMLRPFLELLGGNF